MFYFWSLLWAWWWIPTLAIVAVPVLIHLINMLRHRRVDWAAMEFLLLSQKKHRIWIILKQIILLLLRMAAVAMVVLIVMQPGCTSRFGHLLGGGKTHHIVLLDDSFSMSDRWADTSAMGEAKKVIRRLGAQAAAQTESQWFTLLRFSRAGGGKQPDLLQEPVNERGFPELLDDAVGRIEASHLAVGPAEALKVIAQLLGESKDERRIVYLISDFRSREWNEPTEVRKLLLGLSAAEAELYLVHCVDGARPNLAITALEPDEGIRASGVRFFMKVGVQNFGSAPVRNVPVLLEEDGHSRPAVTVAEVPPGRAVTERFEVNFSTAGEHQVTARLETDAVAVDNYRYSSFRLPTDLPVLLIDGDPDAFDARCLNIVSSPGGSVRTGLRPQIETPRFLSIKSLESFQAIYLLNIDRLDQSALDALERYVSAGGGLAFFVGERTQPKFVNEKFYRDGEGPFPVPLKGQAELLVDKLERAPDINAEAHYVFQDFLDQRNTYLASLVIYDYMAVRDGWKPQRDSSTEVIARVRNGAPLFVERPFGKGRVVAVLTTAAPMWNNWARQPGFVAIIHRLHTYLIRRPAADLPRLVGTPLDVQFDAAEYQPAVRFVPPGGESTPSASVDATAGPGGPLLASYPDTDMAGIYQALLTRNDLSAEVRRYAFNVEPDEGNLETVSREHLADKLAPLKYAYEQANSFQYSVSEFNPFEKFREFLRKMLLFLLVFLLIVEQILAWSTSYHPTPWRPLAAKGAAR